MSTITGEIHVNSIGTFFEITLIENGTAVPIGTATTRTITFKKPTGQTISVSASFSSDGSDGKMRYATVSGDLDVDGWWKLQAYIAMPTWQGYSTIGEFEVFSNL
tara:strand:+ start:308 stop:622 length:315 start_codon:yes stop_codon:yes gene_type:complete